MSEARPLDPRTDQLKRDGGAVDGFRVAGILAELAMKASLRLDVGLTGLKTLHLPRTVRMTLDGYRGEKHVLAHEADKELAIDVAKKVRIALHRLGVEVRDCVVRAGGGAQGEDHDLVLEVVDCLDSLVIKKLSGELKLRRLRTESGREVARKAFDRECVSENQWWLREAASGRWGGRIVIMANFASGRENECDLYADFYPLGGQRQSLIGWPGARRSFVTRVASQGAGQQGVGQQGAGQQGAGQGVAQGLGMGGQGGGQVARQGGSQGSVRGSGQGNGQRQNSKPSWDEVHAKLRPYFMDRRGARMASVPQMLTFMKVPKGKKQNLHRDLERWRSHYHWTVSDLDASKRQGPNRKAGGSPEAVATKEVLQVIYTKF